MLYNKFKCCSLLRFILFYYCSYFELQILVVTYLPYLENVHGFFLAETLLKKVYKFCLNTFLNPTRRSANHNAFDNRRDFGFFKDRDNLKNKDSVIYTLNLIDSMIIISCNGIEKRPLNVNKFYCD